MKLVDYKAHSLTTKRLSKEDTQDVQKLCMSCTDFSLLVDGHAPKEDAGLRILTDLPPNKTLDDKYVFGVYHNAKLVAVIDLIKDYPSKETWMLGLLMIHPDDRGHGLGHACQTSIEHYITDLGGKVLQIGVVEGNTEALRFWEKVGYEQEGTFTYQSGSKTHQAYAMKKVIRKAA